MLAVSLPADWRRLTVAELRAWLRAIGRVPPYLDYMRRERLVAWIERHVVTPTG